MKIRICENCYCYIADEVELGIIPDYIDCNDCPYSVEIEVPDEDNEQ